MPRPVSQVFRSAVYAQETGEALLHLLRLYHASIPGGVLYFANNTTNIISNGETYVGCPFEINTPDDRDDVLPEVRLAIDNVSRDLTATIRSITTPIEAELETVVASTPDVIEEGPYRFTVRLVVWDVNTVSGTLRFEDVLNERIPGKSFTRAAWPALR